MNVEFLKQSTLPTRRIYTENKCLYTQSIHLFRILTTENVAADPTGMDLVALSQSRRIHPKRLAVPPRSSASPWDLPDPHDPVPSGGSEKPKRTQGTTAGRRESGRLRSR